MNKEDIKYMVAVHRAMNLTFLRYKKLKSFFANDWQKVWGANIRDLQASELDTPGISNFLQSREKISPEKEMELLKKCGAEVLVYGEKDYPQNLANLYSPPVLLFCRGKILPTDFPAISVVGSRKLSSYGQRAIEKIVGEISREGVTIVSGLALGADFQAHRTALNNGARTIAVLGSGIDNISPKTNENLAEKFLAEEKGAILSEYLPGTEIRPENFPVRNRIVAGLSRAVIVIEAAIKSGSLITAELAVNQGKEVFAVPGEIFAKNSAGTNQIIWKGQAAPAISGHQILEDLGMKNIAKKKEAQKLIPTTEIEDQVLALFTEDKMPINDIFRQSDLAQSVISSTLAILEIKGLVKNLGNQIYSKNF
jgi:DNA processing protein